MKFQQNIGSVVLLIIVGFASIGADQLADLVSTDGAAEANIAAAVADSAKSANDDAGTLVADAAQNTASGMYLAHSNQLTSIFLLNQTLHFNLPFIPYQLQPNVESLEAIFIFHPLTTQSLLLFPNVALNAAAQDPAIISAAQLAAGIPNNAAQIASEDTKAAATASDVASKLESLAAQMTSGIFSSAAQLASEDTKAAATDGASKVEKLASDVASHKPTIGGSVGTNTVVNKQFNVGFIASAATKAAGDVGKTVFGIFGR